MTLPSNYDAWRLSGPDDHRREVGTEDGERCNRFQEPDEDAPRGYKPKPCRGYIIVPDETAVCETCGWVGD